MCVRECVVTHTRISDEAYSAAEAATRTWVRVSLRAAQWGPHTGADRRGRGTERRLMQSASSRSQTQLNPLLKKEEKIIKK